jgi:hypothetical protein
MEIFQNFVNKDISEEEVRKEVWNSYIPLQVALTPNEIITFQSPSIFYVSIIQVQVN